MQIEEDIQSKIMNLQEYNLIHLFYLPHDFMLMIAIIKMLNPFFDKKAINKNIPLCFTMQNMDKTVLMNNLKFFETITMGI